MMRQSIALLGVAALLAGGGAGCKSSPPPTLADAPAQGPVQVRVAKSDTARTVRAHVGQEIAVSLPGVAGTGYSWEIGSSTGVTMMGTSSEIDDAMVGGPDRTVMHFSCPKSGVYTVPFVYRRPWDPAAPTTQTYTLTVEAGQ